MRAFIFGLLLIWGGVSFARAEGCATLAHVQKKYPDNKIVSLTPGQFHFLQGVYVMTPPLDGKLPPASGAALMASPDGKFTLFYKKGALLCGEQPFPAALAEVLGHINTEALDAAGQEI